MNTYNYKVSDLQRDKDGIIIAASFTITASDGTDSNTHNYNTAFAAPKGDTTAFADVTEEQVIGWIMTMFDTKDDDGVRQNSHEDQADAELEAFKERKAVKSETPWAA
tara:strand:+ start:22 stop:345 length:324 start_codon:yes stop_codon:yes gene_type:complete